MLTYMTSLIAIGLNPVVNELSTKTLVPSICAGITNAIFLTLFIFSCGPLSGGHVNPTITMATFFARLSTFPRTILYVVGQTLGATVGGALVRASLGTKDFVVGGCFIDESLVSQGEAFVIEFTSCLALIFVAFGVALDPRQRATMGAVMGPILVGIDLGAMTFATGIFRPGFSGASLNGARCFGLFASSNFPSYHWVHWVAPLAASAVHGVVYWILPPYKKDTYSQFSGLWTHK